MKLYRLLTGPDTSEFCHKVSAALSKGWELHGSPAFAFDASSGKLHCAQAVTKEADIPHHPDMKLGDQ